MKIKFYKNGELATVIRLYDGASAVKLYDKMLRGDIYENYVFSTNRRLHIRDEYIFIFDYLDCYGEQMEHPQIYIDSTNDIRRYITSISYDKVVVENDNNTI